MKNSFDITPDDYIVKDGKVYFDITVLSEGLEKLGYLQKHELTNLLDRIAISCYRDRVVEDAERQM